MSGKAMNKLLHELGVQYKQGDCWLLYQKHADRATRKAKRGSLTTRKAGSTPIGRKKDVYLSTTYSSKKEYCLLSREK